MYPFPHRYAGHEKGIHHKLKEQIAFDDSNDIPIANNLLLLLAAAMHRGFCADSERGRDTKYIQSRKISKSNSEKLRDS